ncbi:hypothetical protein RRF57_011512 [Xylaria bambusicola]|uniref:Uncharacterized protein n=1 Tax=Xylaria bambusicola TaxID=326684 RepID=A0AAN7UN00_9PEZI
MSSGSFEAHQRPEPQPALNLTKSAEVPGHSEENTVPSPPRMQIEHHQGKSSGEQQSHVGNGLKKKPITYC